MRFYEPQYIFRKDRWGHTVYLSEEAHIELGETVDPDELEEVIQWAVKNAQAKRISYDIWQFESREDAEHFIMLFNLRWP